MHPNLVRFVAGIVLTVTTAVAADIAASSLSAPALVVSAAAAPNKPWNDFPTRIVSHLPDFHPQPAPELSTYGGRLSERRAATGFFRTEKTAARWWLIDPEGYRYINVAVVDVHIPPGSAAVKANLEKQFGSDQQWAKAAITQMRDHGFNGTGGWSDDSVLRAASHPMVYTPIWNFMSEYGKIRGGTYLESGHIGYPNGCIYAFDPEFPAFCDQYAAKHLPALKDDPWLLGHYSDNELPFYRKTLDNFLALPSGDPGQKAATAWIASRRAAATSTSEISDADRHAFLGFVADRYLSITSAAIKKHDPNHLCLGSRFNSYELDVAPVFEAAGRHLDLIAINYYRTWTPDQARMQRWTDWSGKPFLITEWYAKGMDSGHSNMSGAGWTVKTQKDRGHFYQNFALGLLEAKGCVGWHWFKYMDNDPDDQTTDPSNRNSNKGIVTIGFKPYSPLLDAMKELNSQVYPLADYFDTHRQ
ncbi:MAG: hypothetical protein ABIV50_15475 [Opitutus sp.]